MNGHWFGVLLAALFIAGSVSAFSITAPEKVSAYSAWGFETEFELLESFHTATISLDGETLLTLYANYYVALDPFNAHKVINATAFDRKLFVSVSGLEPGNHLLLIETKNSAGHSLAVQERVLVAIDPLDSVFEGNIQSQVDALKNENALLQQQLEVASQREQKLAEQVEKEKKRLSQQQDRLKNLASLVELLQQNLNATTAFEQSTSQQLQTLETRLRQQGNELTKFQESGFSPVTGLTNTPGTFAWSASTLFGLLILLAIIGFTVYRHYNEKLY